MSDYYRDRCRHGGILSNQFITFWWNRQVVSNQYGKPGRKAGNWGSDTIEGDLVPDELEQNRRDQTIDNVRNKFRDDEYYASKDFDLADVKVPLLSVANWGGILLHLRGNVQGYMHAGSDLKYLRFITGRHDLPLYYDEEVELQRSFLDAFLKGDDRQGWSVKGKLPPVDLVLRKGDVGFNDAAAERAFTRRTELEWPIARTQYTPYYLTPGLGLSTSAASEEKTVSYKALGTLEDPQLVQFTTAAFPSETEVTGHVVAHLSVSASQSSIDQSVTPSDIDLFLTLRHIAPSGKEVFYTGTAGDPAPLTKGWLRTSLRKVHNNHPHHREYLPHREYLSTDVQEVKVDTVYEVEVELWPTNVVVEKGGRLMLEISSGDTQGTGIFGHNHPEDRSEAVFAGVNNLHLGGKHKNCVVLPIIPSKA
jgi:predicted acyl esterase